MAKNITVTVYPWYFFHSNVRKPMQESYETADPSFLSQGVGVPKGLGTF